MHNNKHLGVHKSRYLPNDYYLKTLYKLKNLNLGKLKINLVSDGKMSDFGSDFKDFNINYFLDSYIKKKKNKKKNNKKKKNLKKNNKKKNI